jgi:dGTPase
VSGPVQVGYDGHATARFSAEPAKRAHSPARSPFQRDRARVLHSSALRRLAAKTQVVEVGSADFPRTRLTHSLECAQIGRELGATLGCDPDLVDAACLAHDLGHPPFGHNGESALAAIATGCGGFEGNAQSLRLLTRLEAKVPGAGLNLTRATLDATLKYPWLASQSGPNGIDGPLMSSGQHQRPIDVAAPGAKFGCYYDDAEIFGWIRQGAPDRRLCLEAQVMDWSDDVAYSVHDLEDGLHSGLITLAQLRDHTERQPVAELALADYCPPGYTDVAELGDVFDALLAVDCWPERFDGGPRTVAAVKHLTSELIGRFAGAGRRVEAASQAGPGSGSGGRSNPSGPFRSYEFDLHVPRRQRLECALLKAVTAHYVMRRAGAAALQARERELLAELAATVLAGAPGALDPMFRPDFESATSDAARLRVVVDQVASLTDTSALAWHARLCQARPG